jgi:hypothetical protein
MQNNQNNVVKSTSSRDWIQLVARQVSSLRFGVVQIVVHDSQIVQIERTEKFRIESITRTSDLSELPTGYPEAIKPNHQPTRTLEER